MKGLHSLHGDQFLIQAWSVRVTEEANGTYKNWGIGRSTLEFGFKVVWLCPSA